MPNIHEIVDKFFLKKKKRGYIFAHQKKEIKIRMKTKLLFIISAFILFSVFSCDNSETVIPGRLNIKVMYAGEPVVNANVCLASSITNLNKGIYIKEAATDVNGVADFGATEPGTYYYDAFKYVNNNQDYLYGNSSITVKSQLIYDEVISIEKK